MVVSNWLEIVLTDLYSDYFIYLIKRYQLTEINIETYRECMSTI